MNIFIGCIVGIIGFSGLTGLYIYLSKNYTIKKVKELELQLSKLEGITPEELNLLESVREFLIAPVLIKGD